MIPYIRINKPEAGSGEPRRLNPFPGRYLSKDEFDLLQAYIDKRITPLVTTQPVGIVNGLDVRSEGSGSNMLLHIQPGIAVGAGNRLIRLFYPLKLNWTDLINQAQPKRDKPLPDGIYFLTLSDAVKAIDPDFNREPCTRTELDPLRERRLETIIIPGLRLITTNPRWLALPQSRAANRICVRFTKESPHDPTMGDIPVALIKIVNQNPEWIDTVAGRYLSEPNAPYRTFLAHTLMQFEQIKPTDANSSLSQLIGLDFLPAAAPLPATLLQDPASKQPKLAFNPRDLQVELIPVPASTVSGVIARELPRGTVDLIHGHGDRMRLLLAIPDLDYKPNLMDLPQRDVALEDKLFQCAEVAVATWSRWGQQWQLIFGGLDAEQLKLNFAPTLHARPGDPNSYRDDYLITERRKTLEGKDPPMPEPYASHLLSPHAVAYDPLENPPFPEEGDKSLLLQRQEINDVIKDLEDQLEKSFQLLNEMNDYLHLQRQQLDGLTLSFSALAGGIAGDGSGSNMMRWNNAVVFDPITQKT